MSENNRGDLKAWRDGVPALEVASVVVIDPITRQMPPARALLASAAATHEVPGRPTVPEADAIVEEVDRSGARQLVVAGSGVAIDTAKLAVYRFWEKTHQILDIVAVPCGPEPYRAVTPFTMFESTTQAKEREGHQEYWLRPREVWVAPELLELVDGSTVAQHAGDSFVHGVESLLSRKSNATSALNARRAVAILVEQSKTEQPDRVQLVEASIRAAIAFDTTVLGLAHAFSRPLGIAAGTSHDGYNLICGFPTLAYWGDAVIGETDLGTGLPLGPRASDFSAVLDLYRARAGLPPTIEGTGLTRSDMDFALTKAPRSTGIAGLPKPFGPDDFRVFARLAWNGGS